MAAALTGAGALAGGSLLGPAAIIGGGMAISGIASAMGAASSNRAARTAQNINNLEASSARNRAGALAFGPQDFQDFLLATAPRGARGDIYLDNRWQNPGSQALADATARFSAKYPSMIGTMQQAGQQLVGEQKALLDQEHGRTQYLDMLSRQAEGFGTDFEARQKDQINRNSRRDLQGLDRRSMAALGYLGPSTLVGNQLASNQRQIGYQRDDALLAAAKAATDRLMAARQARIGTLGQRYGVEGSLADSVSKLNYQTAIAPSQAAQAVVNGQQFNPVPQSAAGYSPYSPAGNTLASIGPAIAQLGMMGLFDRSSQPQQSGNPQGMWNGMSYSQFNNVKG